MSVLGAKQAFFQSQLRRPWVSAYWNIEKLPETPIEQMTEVYAETSPGRLAGDPRALPPLPPSAGGTEYWRWSTRAHPEFLFEWHALDGSLYVIPQYKGEPGRVAHRVAHNVEAHGQAISTALVWLRGIDFERSRGENKRTEG